MASSSRGRERKDDVEIDAVPAPLRMRLGPDATAGLLDLLDLSQREARDAMITACTERFERRLVEEVSGVRLQIVQVESSIRQDMVQLGAGLRQEMADMRATLRQEIAELRSSLRQELTDVRATLRQEVADIRADLRQDMGEMRAGLREEIAAGRVELFKWCFLFWIGQVLAIGGIVGVMLRLMR